MDKGLIGEYSVQTFPATRNIIMDTVEIGRKRHHMKGLLELDVTDGLNHIHEYEQQNHFKISFTGWLLRCIAAVIAENPEIHVLKVRKKLYRFEAIDISYIAERILEGKSFPVVNVMRKVNEKSVIEITKEIRSGQSISQVEYHTKNKTKMIGFFVKLPKLFRNLFFWRRMKNDPFFLKRYGGLINVTSVGMFGDVAGWPLINSTYPISIAVGSIVKKPWVVNEEIQIRNVLHMTILLDHDTIDGAPAARLVTTLAKYIQNAKFLPSST